MKNVYLESLKENIIDIDDKLTYTIYALWEDNEIVYIGQSTNVYTRLEVHKKSDKIFNKYSFFNVKDKNEMDSVESFLIQTLKPKYNKTVEHSYVSLKDVRKRAITSNPKLKWVEDIYTVHLASLLKHKGYPIFYKGRKAFIPILWLSDTVEEVIKIGEESLLEEINL